MAEKPSYHREDLRGDLIAAGHAFVAENGHERLTIRALTTAVRVSPGAPYHHFADRRALLLALAADGFAQLFAEANQVLATTPPTEQRLSALAAAFLDFQERHPRLLELMYESELARPVIEPAIQRWQIDGFQLITQAIADVGKAGDLTENRRRAIVFWTSLYGFASLYGKGLLTPFAVTGLDTVQAWRKAAIEYAVMAATGHSAT